MVSFFAFLLVLPALRASGIPIIENLIFLCWELLTTNRTSHHFRQDFHLLDLRYFYFMNSNIVCQLEDYL